jgi:hypothetical protein
MTDRRETMAPLLSNIGVIDAVYGSQLAAADVSNKVQQLVIVAGNNDPNASSVDIAANNATLGDPSPGTHKHLTIRYFVFDPITSLFKVDTVACEEGQSVTLSVVAIESNVFVLGAVYGAEEGSEDVTATVQQLVNNGHKEITADDATFGDPAVGHLKNFGMSYFVGGAFVPKALACQEGQTVKIT